MNFDKKINRINTHSDKWDMMEKNYGVDPTKGTPMWVADMDFEPPIEVNNALSLMAKQGVYGYYGNDKSYREAIEGWMDRRHSWDVDPDHIFSTHGLVNGTALCVQSFTNVGDGIVLFTPVYHAFSRVIDAADRKVIECELEISDGRYVMNFDKYDAQMDSNTKMIILCSPHNPGGRVWSINELKQVAEFAEKHNLILISDEIHHDLTFSSDHTVMPIAAPEISNRLVMMTAVTKTFNIAGCHTGNVIIADEKLRSKFAKTLKATGTSPNSFGLYMAEAAYTYGDKWVDELCIYLDGNRKILDATIKKIPGVKSMQLEATYLSWVDFSGTGMPKTDYINRVQKQALIASSHGDTFGTGGETFLRFNFATQRADLKKAMKRLEVAFNDLQ
ncbi:PatB family C-S lyase [Amylibacter sp.]|nr:PatB family C-S lyase [Amylibacter sp.]